MIDTRIKEIYGKSLFDMTQEELYEYGLVEKFCQAIDEEYEEMKWLESDEEEEEWTN